MEDKKYDVFISYSSKDKSVAFTLCEALENEGLICWIAPRNVSTGHYASSIVKGIESSKVLVLVFSKNSNDSTPVLNELELAMGSKIPLIPIRIEETLPTDAMKFYVMSTNWFDVLKAKSVDDFKEFVFVVKQNFKDNKNIDIFHFPKFPKIINNKSAVLSIKNILTLISFLIITLPLLYIFSIDKQDIDRNQVLNILIFNASSEKNLYRTFSKKIKLKYPNAKITIQRNWVHQHIMDKSLIFYQGVDNKNFAKDISEWLPRKQIIKNYKENPKGFFGFSKNRDLIIFVGEELKELNL